jgi:putative DNA methylase
MYGMTEWRDLFNPRQFLGHAVATELYREMVEEDSTKGTLTEIRKAAYVYLAFSLDKFRDYNSRQTRWHVQREVIVNTFDSHNSAMRWAYAEMAFAVEGFGYDWVVGQTAESIERICKLVSREGVNAGTLFADKKDLALAPSITVTCKPADLLDHISDASVDAVVMDPPYGANVMYAELSDFFYVWLKRTAGLVMPELFTRYLTDKAGEAVANKAKFKGQKGADALANRDYQ